MRAKHWLIDSCTCPDQGLNPQPRWVPWLGIELTNFWTHKAIESLGHDPIYIFLYWVFIDKLHSLTNVAIVIFNTSEFYYFTRDEFLTQYHITILKYSEFDYILTFINVLYVFMLLIIILSFQLKELLSAFLVRQV